MEKPDIDLTLHILFNYLEEKGLIVKEATVKSVRKQYFKRKDFEKFLDEKDNKKEFIEKINGLFQINNEASCDDIINLFINARYLLISYPTVYEAKLKYPKSLVLSNEISEEEKNERKTFFILNFKREEKKSHFWLIVISLIILLFCLLPIWPLPVKLAIWWISYIFLVLIVSLLFL